jgi:hypothetical protein
MDETVMAELRKFAGTGLSGGNRAMALFIAKNSQEILREILIMF